MLVKIMYSHGIEYLLLLTVAVVVLYPPLSLEHFIWPLTTCILADLCNHTWVTECGFSNETQELRLFIDVCDMLEYNCDRNASFVATELQECFRTAYTCPPWPGDPALRMGNYRFNGDKLIYDPLVAHSHEHPNYPHTHKFVPPRVLRTTAVPNLPKHMMHGKRRYTPEEAKRIRRQMLLIRRDRITMKHTLKSTKKKFTTKKLSTRKSTLKLTTRKTIKKPVTDNLKQTNEELPPEYYNMLTLRAKRSFRPIRKMVLQNITVMKNGRMMRKIVMRFESPTKSFKMNISKQTDSDYLE